MPELRLLYHTFSWILTGWRPTSGDVFDSDVAVPFEDLQRHPIENLVPLLLHRLEVTNFKTVFLDDLRSGRKHACHFIWRWDGSVQKHLRFGPMNLILFLNEAFFVFSLLLKVIQWAFYLTFDFTLLISRTRLPQSHVRAPWCGSRIARIIRSAFDHVIALLPRIANTRWSRFWWEQAGFWDGIHTRFHWDEPVGLLYFKSQDELLGDLVGNELFYLLVMVKDYDRLIWSIIFFCGSLRMLIIIFWLWSLIRQSDQVLRQWLEFELLSVVNPTLWALALLLGV